MYPQARVFIRTALGWLVVAALVGALLLINQGVVVNPYLATLQPVFYHLLMVGWATQLICGVALWMFPAYTREQPHGDERLGWLVYGGLNAGLALRMVAEPLLAILALPWLGWLLALSALLQAAAIWVFVWLIWPRVKVRPTPPRGMTR